MSIYDISDPAQITRVGRYEDTTRPGYTFAVNGNYAYFNGSIDHFPDPPEYFTDVIDVSDPENPERVNEVPELAGPIRQLSVKDGLLLRSPLGWIGYFQHDKPRFSRAIWRVPVLLGIGGGATGRPGVIY